MSHNKLMPAIVLWLVSAGAYAVEDAQVEIVEVQGMVPVPDYSGDVWSRSRLTGDWGDRRQEWANQGVSMELDWYQSYQDITDGGLREKSEASTNLDYRLQLDLQRMGAVPGALVTARAQSRFGDTVNRATGLLLPVNLYSEFPLDDGDVDFTITELNWTQFLAENFGLLAGKITTTATANEFMGGEGRSQFMNFQLSFSAVLAQLAPYSTLAVGAIWLPNPTWTVTSIVMNLEDASTSSGFDGIGDGTVWATSADYLGSLNNLPGGGSFAVYYGFDANFARIGGLNFDPGAGVGFDKQSDSWAVTWSGWQYLFAESGSGTVDPRDGRQDLQGLGLFAQIGIADEDTNPVSWDIAVGLAGRGSIPGREADTWGAGYFYNDLQDLNIQLIDFESSVSGFEFYYDIALMGSASLTLDVQRTKSAFPSVDDATILGARLNVSF